MAQLKFVPIADLAQSPRSSAQTPHIVMAGLERRPDESGARRREKGLAHPTGQTRGLKAPGNARVRRAMLQLPGAFCCSKRRVL
jgi:hypothetical protein